MVSLGSPQRPGTGMGLVSKSALLIAPCVVLFILFSAHLTFNRRSSSIFSSSFSDKPDYQHDHATSTGDSSGARLENVRNRTLGFEKIFVVAMKERSDRRDALALAAAGTGIDLTFIDGVHRNEIPDKALPPLDGWAKDGMNDGTIGAWRTHANVLREIVQSGVSTAFVFEEDGDWDVRIKDMLVQFAQATRALTQPLDSTIGRHVYADPTFPYVEEDIVPDPITFDNLPKTKLPQHSPYGDGWDLLHIGHCGLVSPQYPDPHFDEEHRRWTPKGHVMINNDPTVPEPHYLHSCNEEVWPTFRQYREDVNHTRVVHHSMKFVCSHGFGISQAGARRLLHYVGIRALDYPFDKMMENYCNDPALIRKRGPCLGTQPPMVSQHRAAGNINKDTEIGNAFVDEHGGEFRVKGFSDQIRYSAMENMEKLLDGREDFEDQFPDTM